MVRIHAEGHRECIKEDEYIKDLKDFKVLTEDEMEESMKISPFGAGKDIIIEGNI